MTLLKNGLNGFPYGLTVLTSLVVLILFMTTQVELSAAEPVDQNVAGTTVGNTAQPTIDMDQRTRELQELRFGMFICWSFSTFGDYEWTRGVDDLSFFRATECDTDQWARTAKEAGMGYILFLTKHHDGFCLWDTDTTDWKVTKAPLGRDVLAELKKSCDKYGIKLALYFSEGDWTWIDDPLARSGIVKPGTPDWGKPIWRSSENAELKKAQLKELLTRYGPIEYIWFDHAQGTGGLNHEETVAWCKKWQPGCFIGFNHGDQTGADIRLGERGKPGPLSDHSAAGPHMRDKPSDSYRLAEFTYPIQPGRPSDAHWFYSFPQYEDACLSTDAIYADYLGAKKYGNIFSLDVGPDWNGRLRKIDVETLRKVGQYIRGEIKLPPPPVSQGKKVKASSEWESANHQYGPQAAVDGNSDTRWGAASGSRDGWLEIDLGAPRTIDHAIIDEADWNRVEAFAIEYRSGEQWIACFTGTQIGQDKLVQFAPVTAQCFRLVIHKANEVPTIPEFQLFAPDESDK